MSDHKGLPIYLFRDQAAWNAWLDVHGRGSPGLWLKFAKASSGAVTVGKPQAIETALAHGWVDGQIDKFDEQFWLVRFAPRRAKSKWLQINRDTAERLIAEGRMTAAGQGEVDRARSDGRWAAAYAPQARAEVPEDFQAALDAAPRAASFFATLKGANRYAVLYRIHDSKTARTRAARIEKFVAMLEAGEVVYPAKT